MDGIASLELRDYVTLLLLFAIFGMSCFALGRLTRNRACYYRGWLNGRREERSRTNAIVIPAKLFAWNEAIKSERERVARSARN